MPARTARLTFARKAICAVLLIALADGLFYDQAVGATVGALALAWTVGVALAMPAARRSVPLAAAALMGAVLVDDPNLLAWVCFWTALASAVLLPRHRFDDAARWAVRLVVFGFAGLVRPLRDLAALVRRRIPGGVARLATLLVLPVAGTIVFGALFALANPLVGNALDRLELPSLWSTLAHLLFWGAILCVVWPSLRPYTIRLERLPATTARTPDLPVATLAPSLVAFNLLFGIQNALDLAFLWSGAALPEGVTLADYAHRGAYTLIATALLAGAFVLVALAPGSVAARSRPVRRLVALWVAQNVLLVASSMLRLADYVGAYSLTEWRIAAFLWMALVAVGLVLIAVRLFAARSATWLLNANAAAAAGVLLASSVMDFGATAAAWNVRQARAGDRIDLCYLHELGPAALLPLVDLERRAGGPELRDRARYLRLEATGNLAAEQADWHGWTWRGARRLAAARAAAAGLPATLLPAPHGRACDGGRIPPPEPQPAPAPLTAGARP